MAENINDDASIAYLYSFELFNVMSVMMNCALTFEMGRRFGYEILPVNETDVDEITLKRQCPRCDKESEISSLLPESQLKCLILTCN